MREYDLLSATEENYKDLTQKLISGLKDLNYDGLSLIGFGSYFRKGKRYIPGISDIDAMMIFPEDVVIDKAKMNDVSDILTAALRENPVDFQVGVVDRTVMRDGRFNTYGRSWAGYTTKEEMKVLVGPDYSGEFKFLFNNIPEAGQVGHNLRKTRKAFMYAKHDFYYHPEKFFENFKTTLRSASSASKQLHYLVTGTLEPERFSGLHTLEEILPKLNISPLKKIKKVYKDVSMMRMFRKNPDKLIKFWEFALNFFEEQIKVFIKKYPEFPQHLNNS